MIRLYSCFYLAVKLISEIQKLVGAVFRIHSLSTGPSAQGLAPKAWHLTKAWTRSSTGTHPEVLPSFIKPALAAQEYF